MQQEKPLPPGAILQRDGQSFAVRITPPSGKISAQDLERMAELIRTYDVPEVKLTSGERIGFYGLTKDNIHDMCDAMPFRTGGHYVQACPGTTWCKFGQQDSMGLARTLEEKFGTMPTPAKIKLGISGCTFSCAESRVRDIGCIGTPKGWRIFVGGNSGMKPRIADELAKELSTRKPLNFAENFSNFTVKQRRPSKEHPVLLKRPGLRPSKKS
nr:NAD(P)/FAD-dependent oxidoreductase [uncultured Desulfobacter sp.]